MGTHEIKLTDERPIKCSAYVLPHVLKVEVESDIQKMLDTGIITLANSPCAFPLVAIRNYMARYAIV